MTHFRLLFVLALVACSAKKDKVPPVPEVTASAGSAATAPAGTDSEQFWKWFTDNAATLRADKDLRHTMESISAELAKTHAGVFAEIGGDGADRTLVLSVDGKKELFPLVTDLYDQRPTVPGWKIVAFRQRAKPGDPALTIELAGKKLDPTQVKVVATPADDKKLDVVVYIPGFTTNEEMGQLGFVILDHTIGEHDMETQIAGVEFAALDKAPANAKPLSELPAMVDLLK